MSYQKVEIGDNGGEFTAKLDNNFNDLYKGSGGIGYIIQPEDDISSTAWWATMSLTYNTFSILSDHDFSDSSVLIPPGVILLFNGGVWSNGTIIGDGSQFFIYGLQQAFGVNLIFQGNWAVDGVCPQYYGAITNESITDYINDCHSEIQACLDSPFSIFFPCGLYYISSGMTVNREKTIYAKESIHQDLTILPDHTRIYTDKDIDFFTIKARINLLGHPMLDCYGAITATHSFFTFDLSLNLSGKIEVNLKGSLVALAVVGEGQIGFNFDDSTSTADGCIYNFSIDCTSFYCRKTVYVSPPRVGRSAQSITWHDWNINCQHCKQSLDLHYGAIINISGWHQAGNVLPAGETSVLPAIYIGATDCIIDVRMVDYTLGLGFNNIWIINNGVRNRYINNSYKLDYYSLITWVNGTFNHEDHIQQVNRAYMPELRTRENKYKLIPTATINKYDGTGYDFDVNLDDSFGLPVATSLNISGDTDFFKIRNTSLLMQWNDDIKKHDEFVEIIIPITDTTRLTELYYRMGMFPIIPYRIQTILKVTGDYFVDNIYPMNNLATDAPQRWLFIPFNGLTALDKLVSVSKNIEKIIIRFIGCSVINLSYNLSLDEIHIESANGVSQEIDIQGGQTIYGNLAVNDGVKEVDLPVYADNAAAKVGGLVAGDPYRTATGVRMVVYD